MRESKVQPYGFFELASKIRDARLDGLAKGLLYFYSLTYNWSENRPSFYEEERIAAHTGMSVSTLHKRRKLLVQLGWITVENIEPRKPPLVYVHEGKNDPNFETMCYSVWTPENAAKGNKEVADMSPEEREKYRRSRQGRRKRLLD